MEKALEALGEGVHVRVLKSILENADSLGLVVEGFWKDEYDDEICIQTKGDTGAWSITKEGIISIVYVSKPELRVDFGLLIKQIKGSGGDTH